MLAGSSRPSERSVGSGSLSSLTPFSPHPHFLLSAVQPSGAYDSVPALTHNSQSRPHFSPSPLYRNLPTLGHTTRSFTPDSQRAPASGRHPTANVLEESFSSSAFCHIRRTQGFSENAFNSRPPPPPPPPTLSSPNTPTQNGSGSWLWQDVNHGRANERVVFHDAKDVVRPAFSGMGGGFRNATMRALRSLMILN